MHEAGTALADVIAKRAFERRKTMEEFMTSLAALGILGSFVVAAAMAWHVSPPPALPDPVIRSTSDVRR